MVRPVPEDMKESDPNWTCQGDVMVHRGPVPTPPPATQQAGSSSTNVGANQPAGSSPADTDEPARGIAAQSKSAPRRMSGRRYARMAEDVYASPCQKVFDKSMKKTWQWRDWWDAKDDWTNREHPIEVTPRHAHIDHMSEHSEWQNNVPWRQHRDRRANNESQTAQEPERKFCPRDKRWG